ncbi:phosphoenolpyruvate--protein phosphotransferase [Mycoplasmopsis agalactiae]|uniref:phosphoenolpyruvate--protein phosphotransferase n=1 Tax=Mycoplasmopsis agalactiae TaxID=2110 RepID=UPI001C6EB2AA|nr:phosphoenolpyruvate--protein phosphotransferase [Mycoplasmopsis agalactiae]MCE6057354.1 phosphoenolpyruvate--protein phosphotransferase [Mycoplasmopsis agalactiae]MCE6079137.1 phosphoenolpyruvate--protein phosphotransferase [Mycoplasmopsis agalactiae]MCE6095526.1 phosphoenolpyruvate--protein phosphotransferase [Mycoplasmopsis agalactiae]MCE6095547.1 phosphoenolpyruvate--protein phosphotransferase [Mycoplasmopsis agalactiae]MCE6114781.1 phosphoenolpyruvate--protein phosphotransferase [Mycopl
MHIKRIGASKGIAIAKAFKIEELPLEILNNSKGAEYEIELFNKAVEQISADIKHTIKMAKTNEQKEIFGAHLLLAQDPAAAEDIKSAIKNENKSAIYATNEYFNNMAAVFDSMDDAYMKERAADIRDILKKFLYFFNGIKEPNLSAIDSEVIIVAKDLSPSQIVQLDKKYVKGFVTNIGGTTSHTAIMARSMNIPSVVGTENVLENVNNDDLIALNGSNGTVIINPSDAELKECQKLLDEYNTYLVEVMSLIGKPSRTKDNHKVEIAANIGGIKDVNSVLENDAEAVGLFRTEFLYMDNDHWPTEEEQFEAYKAVAEAMQGKKVIIRTLDIGGDKTLQYFKFPEEMNPFLGYRAIRLCLDPKHKEVFMAQLRAIIRASEFGKVAIMFPMITCVDEFIEAKKIYLEAYEQVKLENNKIAREEEIEVGLMMETPAAAVLSDQFCKYADFVSIGTNDLIQYSMATDRMNESISYLYQPLNPSILRLVKYVIDAAHKHGKWAGMCGEMAGDPEAVPLLLGLELDEFSVGAGSILRTRKIINSLSFKEMQELAEKALKCENELEVKEVLKAYLK